METKEKTIARCTRCDREMEKFNTFLTPTNGTYVVCWECLAREEKGFNARRDFRRQARTGVIYR